MLLPLSENMKRILARRAEVYKNQMSPSGMEYFKSRGISPAAVEKFHLGQVVIPLPGDEKYRGRVTIPTISWTGDVIALVFGSITGAEPKYLTWPGVGRRLFNPSGLHGASVIHVTEGELDAVTLSECGLPAVGIPGAESWKEHYPVLFGGFEVVYCWSDPDKAGETLAERMLDALPGTVRRVPVPAGHDVNSLWVVGGERAIRELLDGCHTE